MGGGGEVPLFSTYSRFPQGNLRGQNWSYKHFPGGKCRQVMLPYNVRSKGNSKTMAIIWGNFLEESKNIN